MAPPLPPTQGPQGLPNPNQQNPNEQEPTQQNSSQSGQSNKEFHLKKKDDNTEKQAKPDDKKKDDGDGQALQGKVEAKQEGISGKHDDVKAAGKTEEIGASAKAVQMRQINAAVIKMVDSIQHGDGLTEMKLKASDGVPTAFQGTKLTIDQTTSKISFQDFKSEAAAMNARSLINSSPAELQALANQLYDKGFRNTTIEIQNVTITLPKAEQALPSPSQVMSDQSNMEREGGGQQGGQQGRQGGDEGPSDQSP